MISETSKFEVIFILGSQGSGKGTQGRFLAQKLDFLFWDMGAILREERDFVLSDGKKVGDITGRGIYLTDPELIEVIQCRIGSILPGRGIVFDGVPRRIGQAEFIINHLRLIGFSRFITIFIDVAREESIKRLMLRAEKERRIDDTPEAISLRLKQAEELTGSLLEYLKTQMPVVAVDGNPSISKVTENIEKILAVTQ